jgi:hypothetical protein
MLGRIRRRLRNDSGQSFVEFTLVVPLALVMLLGVVDLGKAMSYWLDSSHLANEAARYAAVQSCPACTPPNMLGLPAAIKDQAETSQLKAATSVCIEDLTGPSWALGDTVKVTVSSPYDFLHLLNLASITVKGTSTMRIERDWQPPLPSTNPFGDCS